MECVQIPLLIITVCLFVFVEETHISLHHSPTRASTDISVVMATHRDVFSRNKKFKFDCERHKSHMM